MHKPGECIVLILLDSVRFREVVGGAFCQKYILENLESGEWSLTGFVILCMEGPKLGPCLRKYGLPQYTDWPLIHTPLGPVDVGMGPSWGCITVSGRP